MTGVGGKEVSEADVDDEIADGGRVGPLLTELVTRFSDQVVFNLNICKCAFILCCYKTPCKSGLV